MFRDSLVGIARTTVWTEISESWVECSWLRNRIQYTFFRSPSTSRCLDTIKFAFGFSRFSVHMLISVHLNDGIDAISCNVIKLNWTHRWPKRHLPQMLFANEFTVKISISSMVSNETMDIDDSIPLSIIISLLRQRIAFPACVSCSVYLFSSHLVACLENRNKWRQVKLSAAIYYLRCEVRETMIIKHTHTHSKCRLGRYGHVGTSQLTHADVYYILSDAQIN